MRRIKVFNKTLIFCLCFLFISQPIFAGKWYDLGSGWKMRIDGPHYEGGKPHVHVYDGDDDEIAVENLDGTSSHGSSLDDLPNSVKKRVKEHPEYKRKKGKVKERSSIIINNIARIQDAYDAGKDVVIIGGLVFSVYLILDWAAKLGLIFLFAL